jgi:hypothetical protein
MIVVYAVDALEYTLVEEFNNQNLKQLQYGKTDISEFSEPRTIVLWSSFMTGENKEQEVLAKGDKEMWNTRWPIEETFFTEFKKPLIIDLPGFNYNLKVHDRSRQLLKKHFESEDKAKKEDVRKEYNNDAFNHHRQLKEEFLTALEGDSDLILGYFSIADVIGHLNFGNKTLMRMIYKDLDELAGKAREKADHLLVISDHGMKALGGFGDHSEYGFFSTSWESKLKNPKITDFRDLIEKIK